MKSSKMQSINDQNPLDFSDYDSVDPALKDGYKVLFDRLLLINMRFQDQFQDVQEMSQPEPLNIRVLQLGNDNNPTCIRIEISSEKDLFFLFHHEATPNGFNQIKSQQGLQTPYKDYASIIIATLNKVEMNLNGYTAVYSIMLDGSARLEINQTTEFKSINMIYFDFHQCEESYVRSTISYKYNQQRRTIRNLTNQLQEQKFKGTGTFKS